MDTPLKVRWENVHSNKFGVSNGVRQGGVLSPIIFSIYLDSLLVTLKHADIGCSWDGEFSGALAYADDVVLLCISISFRPQVDDVVLLSPSASGLRLMLRVCEDFASSHGLLFNPFKRQFIQFYHHSHLRMNSSIRFSGSYLPLLNEVLHLGHSSLIIYNLSDDCDILSKCKDMIRKAVTLFCAHSQPLSHCPHLPLSLLMLIVIWVCSLEKFRQNVLKR